MDKLIEKFPAQLVEALEIGKKATIHKHVHDLNKVYVSGLGGSGIGANFVQEFVSNECKIPYVVGKKYTIPAFVDQNTLAIVSSYSGNTEETLEAFAAMQKTGAKIVCISSGGKLLEAAKEKGYDFIQVPGDWPSPRACLGYSVVQQLFILNKLGLISSKSIEEVSSSVNLIKYDMESIKDKAEKIANILHGKIPIIYIEDRMEAVAVRLRQQINENGKMLCWHHVIPEMNHNELVGWRHKNDDFAVLFLRNKDDMKRNQIRTNINKEIIGKYTNTIIEVISKGNSHVERAMYLVHLGDWISWYLAQLGGFDAIEIDVIDHLKSELGKV